MASAVVRSFVALVSLRYGEWLPSDDFSALFVINLLGVVDLPSLAFSPDEKLFPGIQYL